MENNAQLIAQCEAQAKVWLSPAFDEETRKEVQAMLDNPDKTALIDAFYQNLEFGTGGLRGIMGAGTNRMNKYIVGMAGIPWQAVLGSRRSRQPQQRTYVR